MAVSIKPAPGAAGREARATGKIKIGRAVLAECSLRPFRRADERFNDLCCLIKHRYRGEVPEPTDTQDVYAFLAANALLAAVGQVAAIVRLTTFFEEYEPWRRPYRWWAEEYLRKAKVARLINDRTAGKLVKLTLREREGLHLHTMTPFDVSAEKFADHCREKKREADRMRRSDKRRKDGSLDREMYLNLAKSGSVEANKPWLLEGISRRTWYKRKSVESRQTLPRKTTHKTEIAQGSSQGFEGKEIGSDDQNCTGSVASKYKYMLATNPVQLDRITSKSAVLFELAAKLLRRPEHMSKDLD